MVLIQRATTPTALFLHEPENIPTPLSRSGARQQASPPITMIGRHWQRECTRQCYRKNKWPN